MVMTYQSNLGRGVEEYDDFLSDSINNGITNSARGEGTTTRDLVAKFRFLNCGACLVILLHTLPTILNPFRLMHLITSPIKFMLEFIVATLALSLMLVEARIPILGEKVLYHIRDFAGGRFRWIDLNVARGRMMVLIILGSSVSLINYMRISGKAALASSNKSDGILLPGCIYAGVCNITTTNITANITDYSPGIDPGPTMASDVSHISTLFAMVQCTILSPTVLVLFGLATYTAHVMKIFPEFENVRAYEIQEGINDSVPSLRDLARPSWVTEALSSSARGNGYQTILTV